MAAMIFISYRREESIDVVGRMYSWLDMRLPPGSIFFDVQSVRGGTHFREHIERVIVEEAQVVLAIIGKTWLTVTSSNQPSVRRIDEADDLVRQELEVALANNKAIIPVILQGASMPSRLELPASIYKLADINAVTIRSDPDFDTDMRRLRAAIVALCPPILWRPPTVPYSAPPPAAWPANVWQEPSLVSSTPSSERPTPDIGNGTVSHAAQSALPASERDQTMQRESILARMRRALFRS